MKWVLGYAAVIAAVTLILAVQDAPQARQEEIMGWNELSPVNLKAKPDGLWTWAHDWVEGPALIKFEAKGTWQYSPAAPECTADGDLNSLISARNCLMPDAPVGALLAKIGGSTAGAKDGKGYLAGHKAVIYLDQNTKGPILLAINDELTGMSDNSGSITVRIFVKSVPAAASGASEPPPAPPPAGGTTPPAGGAPPPVPAPTPGGGH